MHHEPRACTGGNTILQEGRGCTVWRRRLRAVPDVALPGVDQKHLTGCTARQLAARRALRTRNTQYVR